MTRWLLTSLLVLAMTGWVWLAHGLLWAVPPGPVRIASTPWSCAEPLAFNRSRGDDIGVSFIDMQTVRQLARGLGNRAVDVAVVGLDDLRGPAFAGVVTRTVGLIECGPEVRAAVALSETPHRADLTFKAAWARALADADASPAAWQAHLRARRQDAPHPGLRFVPDADAATATPRLPTGDAVTPGGRQ